MNGRKIPYSEAVRLWKDLKPSDIIVLPDGREIDVGAVRQIPHFLSIKQEGGSVAFRKDAGGDWRAISLYSSLPPVERGHFLSGFLLSLPVIRWFAPRCGARISEGQHVSPREGQHVSLKEALGEPRCTKPRWRKGQHFWRNPN